MMTRSISIVVFFFSSFISAAFGQNGTTNTPSPLNISPQSSEIGIFLGASYYLGDLNPYGHFNRFTKPAAGVLYRINMNSRMSVKAIASYGSVEGKDSYSRSDAHRNRNLSFKSDVLEMAVEGELNFLPFSIGNKKLAINTPYVFAGVAVYHFNPQAYYQGTWYKLQPIGTEGQGSAFTNDKTYSLTQFSIPFGVGVKVNVAKRVGINFEWGLRRTFTDYLDDVSGKYVDPALLASEKGIVAAKLSDRSFTQEGGSNAGRQRGNSFTNDWYSFAGIMITFKMKNKENECELPH